MFVCGLAPRGRPETGVKAAGRQGTLLIKRRRERHQACTPAVRARCAMRWGSALRPFFLRA